MLTTLTLTDLARIAYEASRKLTEALGGKMSVAWEQLPESERQRAFLVMAHYHSVSSVEMSKDPYVSLWQGVYAALYEFVPAATMEGVQNTRDMLKAYGVGVSDNRAADNVPFAQVQNAILNEFAYQPSNQDDDKPAFSGHGGGFGGGGVSADYDPPSTHHHHDSGNSYDSSSSYDSGSSDSGSSSSSSD